MVLRRLHTLRNKTKRTIYLLEFKHGAEHASNQTQLEPYSVRHDFPATKYWNDNLDSNRSSRIVVLAGEDEALNCLAPQNFVKHVELIFEMDEVKNELIVYGIPARLMDYIRRWACGFPGRDYRDRPRDTLWSSKFKDMKPENEGCLLSGPKMAMIHILINYDGEWKNNEEGGYTWSCGANAKCEAILVYENNLTLEVVVNEICETLGLNGLETKLGFSYLPATESSITCPIKVLNARSLRTYLSFGNFGTRPVLHVENLKTKDEDCGEN